MYIILFSIYLQNVNFVSMSMQKLILISLLNGIVIFPSCNSKSDSNVDTSSDNSILTIGAKDLKFDETLAYSYIEKQVAFGPRVPSTLQHEQCAQWILQTLEELADTAYFQEFSSITYDAKKHKGKNILAKLNPKNPNRILLCAHWDTRPVADRDGKNPNAPILGANDAGSGVGVILALLQSFKTSPIQLGIDIVFFDIEDYGQPENSGYTPMENSWCLGSQAWGRDYKEINKPRWGILLDMVGGKDVTFLKEEISMTYASNLVNRVWDNAYELGYGTNFLQENMETIQDDHMYVNTLAMIPTIDLIHYKSNNGGFADYWHTHDDNMSSVDKTTLKKVGNVLLYTILQEDKLIK